MPRRHRDCGAFPESRGLSILDVADRNLLLLVAVLDVAASIQDASGVGHQYGQATAIYSPPFAACAAFAFSIASATSLGM